MPGGPCYSFAIRPENKKNTAVLVGCVIWLAVLGWVDRATGYELGLFAFYSAPVAWAAWHCGRPGGVAIACVASAVWYLADRLAGDHYSRPLVGYWNMVMHFGTFLINALAISKIRSSLDERHALERALDESRRHIRHLVELLPVCPRCLKPHGPDDVRHRARLNLATLPADELARAHCPDCRQNRPDGRDVEPPGAPSTLPADPPPGPPAA